jgi:hypothetical protein
MAAMSSRYRARATLLAAGLALLAGCGGSGGDDGTSTSPARTQMTAGGGVHLGPAFGTMSTLPGALNSAPPWPANNGSSLQLRLRKIGLAPLSQEGQVVHIHQHLDIYVDGDKETVPAQIGIDAGGGFIAALHTHDTSGIMHVESPTVQSFSLGQFFAVWGLPLRPTCIGSLCEKGGRQLRVWVNGRELKADPTRIVLAEHQEIVLAYGTPKQVPDPLPKTYDFAAVGL